MKSTKHYYRVPLAEVKVGESFSNCISFWDCHTLVAIGEGDSRYYTEHHSNVRRLAFATGRTVYVYRPPIGDQK